MCVYLNVFNVVCLLWIVCIFCLYYSCLVSWCWSMYILMSFVLIAITYKLLITSTLFVTFVTLHFDSSLLHIKHIYIALLYHFHVVYIYISVFKGLCCVILNGCFFSCSWVHSFSRDRELCV